MVFNSFSESGLLSIVYIMIDYSYDRDPLPYDDGASDTFVLSNTTFFPEQVLTLLSLLTLLTLTGVNIPLYYYHFWISANNYHDEKIWIWARTGKLKSRTLSSPLLETHRWLSATGFYQQFAHDGKTER